MATTTAQTYIRIDDREVNEMLDRAVRALDDINLAHGYLESIVVPYLQSSTDRNFEKQGTSTGGKWAELLPVTQEYRFYQGFNPRWPINVRYGDFRDWLTSDPGSTSYMAGGAELTFPGPMGGEQEAKLETSMTGVRASAPREVLDLTTTDAAMLLGFFQGYFEAFMTVGGFL